MNDQSYLLDFPFNDPDIVISVEHLLREEAYGPSVRFNDTKPLDNGWLQRTLHAAAISAILGGQQEMVLLLKDYQRFLDSLDLTEEQWVSRFEGTVKSTHDVYSTMYRLYSPTVCEIFRNVDRGMTVLDCSVDTKRDYILLKFGYPSCQSKSPISTMQAISSRSSARL